MTTQSEKLRHAFRFNLHGAEAPAYCAASCALFACIYPEAARMFGVLLIFFLVILLAGMAIRNRRIREISMMSLLAAGIAGFLLFTAATSQPKGRRSPSTSPVGCYNLLAYSLLSGKLALPMQPSPELLALEDPYDFHARKNVPYIWDLSLYKGKYYLYFGITPVLVLYLPFRLLCGLFLPDWCAALVFSLAILLWSLLLLRLVLTRFFAGCNAYTWLFCAAPCIAFSTSVPYLLRRPDIYEVVILSSACFSVGGLYWLVKARIAAGNTYVCLLFGGLFLALAVGSRPNAIFFSVYLAYSCLEELSWRPGNIRRMFPALAALLGPYVLYGGVLALYNFLRFGSFTEFGLTYQLTGRSWVNDFGFSARNCASGLLNYAFRFPEYLGRFPYWAITNKGFLGKGHSMMNEMAVGLLWTVPFICSAPVLFFLWKRFDRFIRRSLLIWYAVAAAMAVFISGFMGIIIRFQVDFVFPFIIPSIILMAALDANAERQWQQRALRFVFAAAAMWGTTFNAAISFTGYYDLFRNTYPGIYSMLERLL